MPRHIILWSLLASFLILVGLWPAAATPITLAATGATAILTAIPAPVWLLAAAIAWLTHRPKPVKPTTA